MWKKIILVISVLMITSGCSKVEEQQEVLRIATTTSLYDSGFMPYITEEFTEATGIEVHVISQPSGQALQSAKDGNVDAVFVHLYEEEMKFMEEGYGTVRQEIMYDYHILVGPSDDPANVAGMNLDEAMMQVIESGNIFISRGDNSGTHHAELEIWESMGIDPSTFNSENYLSIGQGMGAVLTATSEKQAYTLTDTSTYYAMQDDLNLDVMVDKDDEYVNVYSYIIVAGQNEELAQQFLDWLNLESTQELIVNFGIEQYGVSLFGLCN